MKNLNFCFSKVQIVYSNTDVNTQLSDIAHLPTNPLLHIVVSHHGSPHTHSGISPPIPFHTVVSPQQSPLTHSGNAKIFMTAFRKANEYMVKGLGSEPF